jgi:hypothetical protein
MNASPANTSRPAKKEAPKKKFNFSQKLNFLATTANKTKNVKRNQRTITFYALRFTPKPTNPQRANIH